MIEHTAPEIGTLTPTAQQKALVTGALTAIREEDHDFWQSGRMSGKSTVRAMIAQALLDEDELPLYEVVPIVYAVRTA